MTFTFQESAQSASLASGPPRRAMPALAQYRSISPSSALAALDQRGDAVLAAASPATATALPPPAVAARPGDRPRRLAVDVVEHDPGALGHEPAGQRGADAAAAPVTTTPAPVTDSIMTSELA